jgi:hypothetical protein
MSLRQRATRFRPLIIELVTIGTRLAGIALVAVGVSGLLAWGMGTVAGKGLVAGDPPGVTYSAARCADLREYAPQASNCAQAATEHHYGEVVDYRLAAGVLGGFVLAVSAWRRRRGRGAQQVDVLPELFVPTVAAAVAGMAGLLLTGQGVDLVVLKTDGGGGGYLSGGVVALGLALWLARPVFIAIVARLPPATSPA